MSNHTIKQLELPLFEIRIELSKQGYKHKGKYVAIIDSVDAEFAQLNWSVRVTPHTQYAYRAIREDSEFKYNEQLHCTIMKKILGHAIPDGYEVDHIDMDGLNNRRENLRLATRKQNGRNRGKQSNNTSGYKGVDWNKQAQKWRGRIKVNRKDIHLGLFDTPEEAYQAYCEAADKYYGDFANYG